MFEPWPDEPDEPSAETRWGNPERDLPRIPEVSTDERDVDPEILKSFWVSVIFTNAALFGASLGLMLWYFRGQALLGGSLVVVGLLAGARTYVAYRRFKTDQASAENKDEVTDSNGESDQHTDADSDDEDESGDETIDTPNSPERNG